MVGVIDVEVVAALQRRSNFCYFAPMGLRGPGNAWDSPMEPQYPMWPATRALGAPRDPMGAPIIETNSLPLYIYIYISKDLQIFSLIYIYIYVYIFLSLHFIFVKFHDILRSFYKQLCKKSDLMPGRDFFVAAGPTIIRRAKSCAPWPPSGANKTHCPSTYFYIYHFIDIILFIITTCGTAFWASCSAGRWNDVFF